MYIIIIPKYAISNIFHAILIKLKEFAYFMPSKWKVKMSELLHWFGTYVIDVADPRDDLCALMFVLAIDAEKCSRDG